MLGLGFPPNHDSSKVVHYEAWHHSYSASESYWVVTSRGWTVWQWEDVRVNVYLICFRAGILWLIALCDGVNKIATIQFRFPTCRNTLSKWKFVILGRFPLLALISASAHDPKFEMRWASVRMTHYIPVCMWLLESPGHNGGTFCLSHRWTINVLRVGETIEFLRLKFT
jgi:hypothetical protein